jgi:ABC-2 type transport system permease protein
MTHTLTIARREFASFYLSPVAYIVMCPFILFAALLFMLFQFRPDQPAEMRQVFFWLVRLLVLITPAVSMRLITDELRSGTIETLMTSPVSDIAVVLGKWLGALGFFATLLLPTLAFVIVLEIWSNPDYGPILSGYIGLMLVGGLYLAIGVFASVLTRNQIVAYLITIFIILFFIIVTYFLPRFLPPTYGELTYYLNFNEQYESFAKGLIDTSTIVYFLSGIALFLVLAVKALETRKWR